jgi:G3E family GTPase
VHAVQTSLWHELAIIAGAAMVVWCTWGGTNQVGTWTFMILWWMHQSAKLNVFLGVRNLNEEFLPEHLGFLKAFLTKRPMNLLFPFSVTISTVVGVLLVQQAIATGASSAEAAGATFLATLMALAILEHWFLVLPLPSAKLWSWGLASRAARSPFDVDIAVGFLGSGKTTFLRRLLDGTDPQVRTVALVNDFAELGIDASLLKGRGADVVELANGCICCSLRQDLAKQLRDVVTRFAPQRVVIEPSGVADVASLLAVLNRPEIAADIVDMRVYTIVDSSAFRRDYARMPQYFEAQAGVAKVFVVNKTDLVGPAELSLVESSLRMLNPRATIVPARYGQPIAGAIDPRLASIALQSAEAREAEADHEVAATPTGTAIHRPAHHHHDNGHDHAEAVRAAPIQARPGSVTVGQHDHDHDADTLGLESWSARVERPCDVEALGGFLRLVTEGEYGQVERMKGIVQAREGWLRFDVAAGRSSIVAFSPAGPEQPRIMAIGRLFDRDRLLGGLSACAEGQAA